MNAQPPVVFGIVLNNLEGYRTIVKAIAGSPLVAATDFIYTAPIYKGNDAIKEALQSANGALEKFDVYYENAIENPAERVRFAKLFEQQYLRKFPGSERQDLFLASGDVMKFMFELVPPLSLDKPFKVLEAIERTPHDASLLHRLRAGESLDRAHLKGDLKIFLDHILNPRRRELRQVQAAAMELETDAPLVLELATSGGIPGYVWYAVKPIVEDAGGKLVLLPG